mmetsp:Transcript_6122/g.6967  ORF Transcript_6122/g.6967 Transcript_6122/m.6967 type:complete len:212 (-) Transcript_6122:216-851(-)
MLPNRESGQIRMIGFPLIFVVSNDPQTLESTETEPQSPNTNTFPLPTVCDSTGWIYRSINLSGSVSHKSRPNGGVASLIDTAPVGSTVTVSPGRAAMRFTNKSRSDNCFPPLEDTISRRRGGGAKSTISPTLLLFLLRRGVTFSTRRTSPTWRVGSMDLLGMKKNDTSVESKNADPNPPTAVNNDPIAETALNIPGVYNLGRSDSFTRTGH